MADAISLLLLVISTRIFAIISQEAAGPICYSCARTDNPQDCRHAETCTSSQVCSVQEVIAPHGDFYFWSGCEDIGICEDLSYTSTLNQIIGRRQTSSQASRCSYCCDGDMCNRNCTSFVNLALNKPAYQSSVAYNGPANLAVDGNTTKNYYKGSCTHTQTEHYPWWTVDLENDYRITKVKLYERFDAGSSDDFQFQNGRNYVTIVTNWEIPHVATDRCLQSARDPFSTSRDEGCHVGRSFHLKILVSTYNATLLDRTSPLFTQCGYYYGHSSDGNAIIIDCPKNTHGRWVRVQQSDPNYEFLHLCEVEVFGF